jgi:ribosomal protein S18 acetylase RimI-like enzyme
MGRLIQDNDLLFPVYRNVGFYAVTTLDGSVVGGVFAIKFPTATLKKDRHYPAAEFVEICKLNINPEFRGRGYGARIMTNLLADYRTTYLCLMVAEDPDTETGGLSKPQLIGWYKRMGFVMGSPFHVGENWMSKIPAP